MCETGDDDKWENQKLPPDKHPPDVVKPRMSDRDRVETRGRWWC